MGEGGKGGGTLNKENGNRMASKGNQRARPRSQAFNFSRSKCDELGDEFPDRVSPPLPSCGEGIHPCAVLHRVRESPSPTTRLSPTALVLTVSLGWGGTRKKNCYLSLCPSIDRQPTPEPAALALKGGGGGSSVLEGQVADGEARPDAPKRARASR